MQLSISVLVEMMKEIFSRTSAVLGEILLASCESIRVLIGKAASRKLLVWAVATHMTYIGILDPNLWFAISSVFLGLQGAIDFKSMASNFIQKSEQSKISSDQKISLPELKT